MSRRRLQDDGRLHHIVLIDVEVAPTAKENAPAACLGALNFASEAVDLLLCWDAPIGGLGMVGVSHAEALHVRHKGFDESFNEG